MNKNQIIKSLKDGKYEIEVEKSCSCRIDWHINNGNLYNDISQSYCYVASHLNVEDENGKYEEIASYDEINSIIYNGSGMKTDEFVDLLWDNDLSQIIRDMEDCVDDNENTEHSKQMLLSLIDFIEWNNYSCYISYPRNFGNEYECILVNNDVDEDEIPEGAEKVDAEEFANAYLESGDSATNYYIDFKVIEPEDKDEDEDEDEDDYYEDDDSYVGEE